ncbi:unnamed protein product [Arabidopsis halleri]
MWVKFASKIRDLFEGASGSNLQLKPARTLVLLGCSGNGKSATGNSILGREAFESKRRAAAVTKECNLKNAKLPNGQIINVIDTPGLFSLYPSNDSTIQEILKCFRLAKEGIDAVLMVFSLRSRLTEEEKSVLLVLKILFGNDIVDYMIVVFTNEDSFDDNNDTMEDYLKECPAFKEILAVCENRMVQFDNRAKASESKKAKQVQEFLHLVEEVVRKNNNKPFTFGLQHETMGNEAVFKEKQKKIRAMKGSYTKQEMSDLKEVENSDQHQLSKMVETRLMETATMLEQKLTEEKIARLEADLREKLDRAEEELKKKNEKCIIL